MMIGGNFTNGERMLLYSTSSVIPLQHYDRGGEGDGNSGDKPHVFSLQQNYPNPFNPTTVISFQLAVSSLVTLKLYNVLGQEVAKLLDRETMDDGSQEVEFDASRLASGVYFYRIVAEGIGDAEEGIAGQRFVSVKKLLFLK